MGELETLKHAKNYLDQLALGIDPISATELPDDSALNQVRLARCFFYVSGVLARVIDSGGEVCIDSGEPPRAKRPRGKKQPFSATAGQLARVKVGAPAALSVLIAQINNVVFADVGEDENVRKLSYRPVMKGLIEMGFFKLVESAAGNQNKVPTEQGMALGVTREQRINPNGQPYPINLFGADAQQFVLDNLDGILSASEDA